MTMQTILSPRLTALLASNWGKDLGWVNDADTMEAFLCAVGEFGRGWAAVSIAQGARPEPHFQPGHGMSEEAMRRGVRILGQLAAVGRVELQYGPFEDRPSDRRYLSKHDAAFSPAYRVRLAQSTMTAWAESLDENNLGTLLWALSIYAIRVCSAMTQRPGDRYPPPQFDGPPEVTRRMRAALQVVADIYRSEPITAPEARRRIRAHETGDESLD